MLKLKLIPYQTICTAIKILEVEVEETMYTAIQILDVEVEVEVWEYNKVVWCQYDRISPFYSTSAGFPFRLPPLLLFISSLSFSVSLTRSHTLFFPTTFSLYLCLSLSHTLSCFLLLSLFFWLSSSLSPFLFSSFSLPSFLLSHLSEVQWLKSQKCFLHRNALRKVHKFLLIYLYTIFAIVFELQISNFFRME